MTHQEALELLKQNVQNENLIKHCLAVEAIMKALASFLKEDEEKWGLCGLLHDIDYEKTKLTPKQHSLLGAQILLDLGIEKDICQAVKVHNEIHGFLPERAMEKALFVTDPLSGLIVAAVLISPSKKISDIDTDFVLRRFKEKAFARGVNREIIKKCEKYLNLSLRELVEIGLKAMQEIALDLEL